jgi:hypothetical protein
MADRPCPGCLSDRPYSLSRSGAGRPSAACCAVGRGTITIAPSESKATKKGCRTPIRRVMPVLQSSQGAFDSSAWAVVVASAPGRTTRAIAQPRQPASLLATVQAQFQFAAPASFDRLSIVLPQPALVPYARSRLVGALHSLTISCTWRASD